MLHQECGCTCTYSSVAFAHELWFLHTHLLVMALLILLLSIGFNNIMTVLSIAIEIMLGSTVLIFVPAIELGSYILCMQSSLQCNDH